MLTGLFFCPFFLLPAAVVLLILQTLRSSTRLRSDCSDNDLQLYPRAFALTRWELAASFEKSRVRLLNSRERHFRQSHFPCRGGGLAANADRCLLGRAVIVATQETNPSLTTSLGHSLAEAERGAIHRLGGRGRKTLSNNPE